MAELNTSLRSLGHKRLPKNIRVDLTPMVDLGFLLITFFIITTTMLEQKEMKLFLPKDSPDSTLVKYSTTLVFILNRKDSIGYYDGLAKDMRYAKFISMRNIIQQKQLSMSNNHIDKKKLTLIIKPSPESSYENFINALDEVSINDCTHYFVAEPAKSEILQ